MEVRQLRYFVLAAELEHFGAAAERLHIVQPAVSKQIASMERELGLTLFDRTHRRAILTADGRAFLPHARRALQAIERATTAAADLAHGVAGILRIASSEGLGARLHAILASYRASHPQVTVELGSAPTPTKLRLVTAGDLDAAFVRAAPATAAVTVHHLWDEPLLLAVPTERANTAGDLRALADLPLARADRDDNPGAFDLITRACRTAGFDPRPGPRLASVQDILAGPIAAGECWTLLYASTAPHDSTSVTVLAPVPAITVPTGLAVRSNNSRSARTSEFIAAARQQADRP